MSITMLPLYDMDSDELDDNGDWLNNVPITGDKRNYWSERETRFAAPRGMGKRDGDEAGQDENERSPYMKTQLYYPQRQTRFAAPRGKRMGNNEMDWANSNYIYHVPYPGKRSDTTLLETGRRSSIDEYRGFLRIGRQSNFLRIGRQSINDDTGFLRIGRDPKVTRSKFIRIGRAPHSDDTGFLRIGRAAQDGPGFLRIGRAGQGTGFLRIGRAKTDDKTGFLRIGRASADDKTGFLRIGRASAYDNKGGFLRIGRDQSVKPLKTSTLLKTNFLRIGKRESPKIMSRRKRSARNKRRIYQHSNSQNMMQSLTPEELQLLMDNKDRLLRLLGMENRNASHNTGNGEGGYFAFPRQGRAMSFYFPRMGRSGPETDNTGMCCGQGVRSVFSGDKGTMSLDKCPREQECCRGLKETSKLYSDIIITECVSEDNSLDKIRELMTEK